MLRLYSCCALFSAALAGCAHLNTRPAADAIRVHPATCEGVYPRHLQGICTDDRRYIFWSLTEQLIKTDLDGRIIKSAPVADHHGDLCFLDGNLFVAVNLGKFNEPAGKADSWVYVYRADDLMEIARYPVPQVVHGAGGMAFDGRRFIVIGGLPRGASENYAYEYDRTFNFIARHTIASGYTLMGIQTAAFKDGHWWFGCYGNPKVLIKTDSSFNVLGQYAFDGSFGIAPLPDGRFLIGQGTNLPGKRNVARVAIAVEDARGGLRITEQPATK